MYIVKIFAVLTIYIYIVFKISRQLSNIYFNIEIIESKRRESLPSMEVNFKKWRLKFKYQFKETFDLFFYNLKKFYRRNYSARIIFSYKEI